MARWRFLVLALAGVLVGTGAHAQIPRTLSYQGLLTDTVGTPLPDGSYSITFRLYQTSAGGGALWQEAHTLQTKRGVFATNLGGVNLLSLPFDRQYWMSIQIGGNPELTPRMALNSSAYSLHTQKADTATFAMTAPQQAIADSARVAGSIPNNSVNTAKIQDDAVTSAKILDGAIQRVDVANNFKAPRADTSDFSLSGSGPWVVNGSDINYTNGSVSIGTTSSGAKLSIVTSSNGNAIDATGLNGVSASGTNIGVGANGGNIGVSGFSSSGTGVNGASTNSYGVYASSTNGYGVYAVGGPNGVVASAVSGAGVSATSSGGPGVVALGGTNGVEASGTTRGVYAGGGTYGVVSFATSNVFPSYGIYASDNGTPVTTYAGFFSGQVKITSLLDVDGFIFKNGGGFKIDHPTDPAHKYLYHSFVESPDMKNIYDGIVTIDAQGEATVTLPEWFRAVNKDCRYQLTAMGQPGPNLYIAEEVSTDHFKIAGGTAGMKVSWQVTGIRKDAYAEAHRIPVEEEKSTHERGKYRNPKELGVPETLGIHSEETQRMAAERKRIEDQHSKMKAEQKQQEGHHTQMEPLLSEEQK
jgi:hypothetical protein